MQETHDLLSDAITAERYDQYDDWAIDGILRHVAEKFYFSRGYMEPQEASNRGGYIVWLAFTSHGVGWIWDLASDDIKRAPQYDCGLDGGDR
jgi:hypothetical protein